MFGMGEKFIICSVFLVTSFLLACFELVISELFKIRKRLRDRIQLFKEILTKHYNKSLPIYRYEQIEITLRQFKEILQPWVIEDYRIGYNRIKSKKEVSELLLTKEAAQDLIIQNLIEGNRSYFNLNLKEFYFYEKNMGQ
jgi:hypothetical protein